MSRLFNCFSQATASTSRSSDTLRPPHPETQSQTFHSAPILSSQHRNNGYENLTLHFTQSESDRERRRAWEEERLRGFPHRGEEGRGRVFEGIDRGDVTARHTETTREGEDWGMGTKVKEEPEDDVSELRLDRDGEGAGGEQEARVVTITSIQPVDEVAAEIQGEEARKGERAQSGRGKGKDYCTPEARRRVEGWTAGCQRVGCKGFVKSLRGATGGSEENSGGDNCSGDGDGNDNSDEGGVTVGVGGLTTGWPEWGSSWGAYKFMS